MNLKQLTPDEQHERNLQQLKEYRPLDDDFMRELFRNNLPLAQFVLRIITGIEDLVLISEETQYDLKRLIGARSICLDVMGIDSKGQKFDLEVQRADKGARPKRARYHSSAMDIEFLDKNHDFEDLPNTYTIFITENDVFNSGEPLYPIERINTATGKSFDDGEHILYVNGAYVGDSDIGKLMHDFRCSDADDMYFDVLADRMRYFKEKEEGVSYMSKIMEDRLKENTLIAEYNKSVQFALNLLARKKDTYEEIAELTGLTLEEVKELAAQTQTA